MTNIQNLLLAYKHLSKLSLSGVFDFDILILSAKRKLNEAIISCVSEDDFIRFLSKK